jgi:hypothetical protein
MTSKRKIMAMIVNKTREKEERIKFKEEGI